MRQGEASWTSGRGLEFGFRVEYLRSRHFGMGTPCRVSIFVPAVPEVRSRFYMKR